jgi:type IV pilus assembly protein PilP
MIAWHRIGLAAFAALLLAACSGEQHGDLRKFMSDVKARPAGEIEPIPTFPPYQAYKYSNVAMRSPFDPPQQVLSQEGLSGKAAVKPDESRRKQYLESFSIASLSMVGTLSRDGTIWALINDGSGGIHRVTVGDYLGRNYGRIVSITPLQVDVIEIVPDGKGGWVERPRTLALKEKST